MKRREFVGALGWTALLTLAAQAQQAMPLVGILHPYSRPLTPLIEAQFAAFRSGLKEGGFLEGQNVAIEYRSAEGRNERLPELAAELVRRNVNVLVAVGGPASNQAGKNATSTIPVVFSAGADPVKQGLVTNLRRPGGNVTGITFLAEELGAKALSLLRELVPDAKTVGLMLNPNNPETPRRADELVSAARSMGLMVEVLHAATSADIDSIFTALPERQPVALLLGSDPFYATRIQQLIALAAQHRVPTMYYRREFAEAGGLASYGASVVETYRLVGVYVARILKGELPGELPVMQADKYEFGLNLKTARALGIDVPMRFSAAADEIIE
jgi:putative ABC transport system substrate-binding protein